MEKEKQQSSLKVKIISLVISLLVCFMLIGVSVWAALQQTVTIDNTITITTAGNTRVKVDVSEYLNEGSEKVDAAPSSISSWTPVDTKADSVDSDTISPTAILFSVSDNHNYYAYKIDFTNNSVDGESSVVTTYAHITSSAVDNTQLTIYYGENLASMTALGNNTAMDADVTLDDATLTSFYVVVAVSAENGLAGLTAAGAVDFDLNITIDQTNG